MLIKINRVKTLEELKHLIDLKVDIIGITIDRHHQDEKPTHFDSRALSLQEGLVFRKQMNGSKLAVFINHYSDNHNFFQQVLDRLKPDYINIYLPFSEKNSNKSWFDAQVQRANKTKIPIITFGDSIGYDTPFKFKLEDLKSLDNLAFNEISVDTLNKKQNHHIKSEKFWKISQEETSDLLIETVQKNFEKMNVLIDDKLDAACFYEEASNCNAKGMIFSLSSISNDMWTEKSTDNFLSKITQNTSSLTELTQILTK